MSNSAGRFWARVMQQARLITMGHILNAPWKPREVRRKKRYKATRDAAFSYLRRYDSDLRNIKAETIELIPEPERAFSIWLQGEYQAPPLVKACFRSMKKHLKQEVIILDENSLFDWITLPDYVIEKWKKGLIPHAHFSDICRVELLYQHGGLWFDATDFVTAPVPQYIMDEDFFVFMSGHIIRGSYSGIQNCFIRARKGNTLLGIWREAILNYWKDENSKINYFVHHLLLCRALQVNDLAKSLFDKMPHIDQDPTHALWGEHCLDRYDEAAYKELTGGSFFQKTNYKDKRLNGDLTGTVAEHILNS